MGPPRPRDETETTYLGFRRSQPLYFAPHSRVAQLVEQPAVNRRVAGSSPASGASQLSAPQSLSDGPFGPSGAGDGLVTVSGSLSGVGTAHARSRRAGPPHAGDAIR